MYRLIHKLATGFTDKLHSASFVMLKLTVLSLSELVDSYKIPQSIFCVVLKLPLNDSLF